jgi:hypothetical protein
VNDLFDRIKRLFAPPPRPPAETVGEATADRPPPRPVETTPVEPSPIRTPVREVIAEPIRERVPEQIREPVVEPPGEAAPEPPREPVPESSREPADVDELAEVRAALQAVADSQVQAPEPEPEVLPPSREPTAEPLFPPTPATADTSAPTDAELEDGAEAPAVTDAAAAIPTPPVGRVGEALVLTLGSQPVTFTVTKTSATVGRGQENTIRLDDLSVSRRHARIAYRQGGYWLSDLGSMGGTWVNGTRLSAPRRLAFGEVIDIGLLRLTVGFAGGAATTETKKTDNTEKADTNRSAKPRSEIAGQVRRRR